MNPCIQTPYGLCSYALQKKETSSVLPKGFRLVPLSFKHAGDIETLLKEHYTIYQSSRISLSKERIRQGFQEDKWIGVGVFTLDRRLLGCCISKPLGRMKFPHEILPEGGVVEYFCVHRDYRKQGFASCLLDELVSFTAQQGRTVHIFMKEGFPILSLPPLYTSRYLVRKKQTPSESKEYIGSMGIGLHMPIEDYSHAEFLPLQRFAANLPYQLNGDSELFGFTYKGHTVFLCVTNLHHRTVPEGKTIGELSWCLPKTAEVPLSIQQLAVETCVDCSKFDYILLDSKIPHDKKKRWSKDATFSWYIFNYNPGGFFNIKPFWIF